MDPILQIQLAIQARLAALPALLEVPILAEATDDFLTQVQNKILLGTAPVALLITTPEAGPDQADSDLAILTELTIEVRQLYRHALSEIPTGLTPSNLGAQIRLALHGASPGDGLDTLRFAGFTTELDEDLGRTARTQKFTLTAQLL